MRKLAMAGKYVTFAIAATVIVLSAVLAANEDIIVGIMFGIIIGIVVYVLTASFVKSWEEHYGE